MNISRSTGIQCVCCV